MINSTNYLIVIYRGFKDLIFYQQTLGSYVLAVSIRMNEFRKLKQLFSGINFTDLLARYRYASVRNKTIPDV